MTTSAIFSFVVEMAGRTEAPFTDEYVQGEIDFYGVTEYQNNLNTVRILTQTPTGILPDYFNTEFLLGQFNIPALVTRLPDPIMDPAGAAEHLGLVSPAEMAVDDRERNRWGLWMSLSPMEIQSAYIAIGRSGGVVGTAGLGMGYYTLRAAALDEVEKLYVFEQNPEIIAFFNKTFKDRKGFDKIEIVQGDARETCKGYEFDFFFSDIYRCLLSDEAIEDIELFNKNNQISMYQFWGEEKIILHMTTYESGDEVMPRNWMNLDEAVLFYRWEQSEKGKMYNPLPIEQNREFCERYVELASKHTNRREFIQ